MTAMTQMRPIQRQPIIRQADKREVIQEDRLQQAFQERSSQDGTKVWAHHLLAMQGHLPLAM